MQEQETQLGLIARVREGMSVLDAAGERIGTVDYIKLGDPEAVTTQGNEPTRAEAPDPVGVPLGLFAAIPLVTLGSDPEPHLREPLRSEFVRRGFLKIDGAGWFGRDYYVTPDRIASVEGDTVRLTVHKSELPVEE